MSKNLLRKNITLKNTNHKASNIVIDKEDLHIPRNMPTAIIASKGSGKTTLLRSLIETTYKKTFKHIYFFYANTIDDDMPEYLIKIPIKECETFLSQLFGIKSLFNSYYNFFTKFQPNKHQGFINIIRTYFDNKLIEDNSDIIYGKMDDRDKLMKIIDRGEKFLKTYEKEFQIGSVFMDGLTYDDNDLVIIDDMAIAATVLFKKIDKSLIYPYFTLTRHINTAIVLSGQTVYQIPKMIRREITCWLLSSKVSLKDLTEFIPSETLKEIESLQNKLEPFEFAGYNSVDNELFTI